MIVRKYQTHDYEMISEWYKKRGLTVPNRRYLPTNGIIAENIACGFVYLTDSEMAIIDCFISNPDSVKEDRDRALDKITEALMSYAKFFGSSAIKADSNLMAIQHRAEKYKFRYVGVFSSYFREI